MQSGIQPTLALVSVGEDAASKIYLGRKARACAEVGIEVRQRDARRRAATRARSSSACGRSAPIPKCTASWCNCRSISPRRAQRGAASSAASAQQVIEAIPPGKDVDGFHPDNVGRLSLGLPCLMPCTPRGIVELLRHHGIALAGAHAVVLGRSSIVGRPLATLLSQKGMDCTVTLGHSASGPTLQRLAREADILVAAMGRPEAVTAEWVKPGATVVDVGIHRDRRRVAAQRLASRRRRSRRLGDGRGRRAQPGAGRRRAR